MHEKNRLAAQERVRAEKEKALEEADKTVTATYYMPHMAQAPMEPPVAIVQFNGDSAEAWAPVQHPRATREGPDPGGSNSIIVDSCFAP